MTAIYCQGVNGGDFAEKMAQRQNEQAYRIICLERELAAKDKEIADIRAERLRNETFWLGFLQNELATQQKSTNEKNTTQTSF